MTEDQKRGSSDGPVSRSLRAAIRNQGWTAKNLAKQAGVSARVLQQFLDEQGGLTLATVDLLAAVLRLTLRPDES